MAQKLADGQHGALRNWIFGSVCGVEKNMEGFETFPERMRRICEAAMGKSVSHQEVTEFVVDARVGKEKLVQQGDAQSNDEKKENTDRKDFTRCQASGKSLEMEKKAFRGARDQ